MSPENDKLLCQKYPKIFAERCLNQHSTAMCWGFDCGDGWFSLIDELCRKIQLHIDISLMKNQLLIDSIAAPQVVARQVKEKSGMLRFNYLGGDDYVRKIVDIAQERSLHVCQRCGHESYAGGNDTSEISGNQHICRI